MTFPFPVPRWGGAETWNAERPTPNELRTTRGIDSPHHPA
jgi:hypothetical protein